MYVFSTIFSLRSHKHNKIKNMTNEKSFYHFWSVWKAAFRDHPPLLNQTHTFWVSWFEHSNTFYTSLWGRETWLFCFIQHFLSINPLDGWYFSRLMFSSRKENIVMDVVSKSVFIKSFVRFLVHVRFNKLMEKH